MMETVQAGRQRTHTASVDRECYVLSRSLSTAADMAPLRSTTSPTHHAQSPSWQSAVTSHVSI